MRLIFIDLEGYKRFRHRCVLDVNGPLIALVGANNSGKSTVLRAISRLEDKEPILDICLWLSHPTAGVRGVAREIRVGLRS